MKAALRAAVEIRVARERDEVKPTKEERDEQARIEQERAAQLQYENGLTRIIQWIPDAKHGDRMRLIIWNPLLDNFEENHEQDLLDSELYTLEKKPFGDDYTMIELICECE